MGLISTKRTQNIDRPLKRPRFGVEDERAQVGDAKVFKAFALAFHYEGLEA